MSKLSCLSIALRILVALVKFQNEPTNLFIKKSDNDPCTRDKDLDQVQYVAVSNLYLSQSSVLFFKHHNFSTNLMLLVYFALSYILHAPHSFSKLVRTRYIWFAVDFCIIHIIWLYINNIRFLKATIISPSSFFTILSYGSMVLSLICYELMW